MENNIRKKSIQLINSAIEEWKNNSAYTFQIKDVYFTENPTKNGEFVMQFRNTLRCYFFNNELIPISLLSDKFYTNTLSQNPISDNANSDKYLLENFLEDFDTEFYKLVCRTIESYPDGELYTSDPLFFK